MENSKLTKKDMFILLAKEVQDNEVLINFINKELELLEKKSSNRKSSFEKEDTIILVNRVIEIMQGFEEPCACKDIHNQIPELASAKSTSKVSSILTRLVTEGKVTREVVKGKPMFSLNEGV